MSKVLDDLSKSSKQYAELYKDDLKLQATRILSLSMSKILAVSIILIFSSIALFSLAVALVLALALLVNSYIIACLIVTAIFLIITLILFAMRKHLFVNQFVKFFIKVFFDEGTES